MSKRTKSELLIDLENMTEEKDILFDKLEAASIDIEYLEGQVSDLEGKADTLDILIDLLDRYHIANQRYLMGIASELETIEKLTEKLLDMRSIN